MKRHVSFIAKQPNPKDRLNRYADLDTYTRTVLLDWIRSNIEPWMMVDHAPKGMKGPDSKILRSFFQKDTGFYVKNGQFKAAMLCEGYRPVNPDEAKWRFIIFTDEHRALYGTWKSFPNGTALYVLPTPKNEPALRSLCGRVGFFAFDRRYKLYRLTETGELLSGLRAAVSNMEHGLAPFPHLDL